MWRVSWVPCDWERAPVVDPWGPQEGLLSGFLLLCGEETRERKVEDFVFVGGWGFKTGRRWVVGREPGTHGFTTETEFSDGVVQILPRSGWLPAQEVVGRIRKGLKQVNRDWRGFIWGSGNGHRSPNQTMKPSNLIFRNDQGLHPDHLFDACGLCPLFDLTHLDCG